MQCDVLIVGAGPGGSAAAYWLARTGADVLLVDKSDFPRVKSCGDGLTPHALDLVASMGLDDVLYQKGQAVAGVRIFVRGSMPSLVPFRPDEKGQPRQGSVLLRRDMDSALCQRAIATGARFLPGFRALAPHRHQGQLAGVTGHHNGKSLTIHAQLIVIATGANRTLLKAFGFLAQDQIQALALRSYVANLRALDGYMEIHLDRELLPGYAWVFPMGDGVANVGAGIRTDGMTAADAGRRLRTVFDRFLRGERLAGSQLMGRSEGFPLRTDFPSVPTVASRVLVVGEAAGLVNPLTGEGVSLALESGRLAAEIACEALRAGDLSRDRLDRYQDVLRERYADYFNDARELIGRLAHPKVLDALAQLSQTDDRIQEAITTAIVDGRPRDGIVLLGQVLRNNVQCLSASALFTLNVYRSLLDRCRGYMLAQVRLDTPSASVLKMLGRGKMLRALLVFLGCQAAGRDPDQVLAAAAGIELVHAASLIHDDIMDDADTRRGLPALHTVLGTPRAIVCGDYLIAKSFRLLAECRTSSSADQVVQAFIIGAESGIRTCRGQFRDVGAWTEEMLNEETYDQLIGGKTAAAIAGALIAGATLAGGDRALLEALSRYGECVGRAFQIRDDILDFVGDSIAPGLMDRRPTLPLIHAFQHSDHNGKEVVRQFLNGQEIADHKLARLLQDTGSLTYAIKRAGSLSKKAVQLAQSIPQVHEVLEAIARYVVLRNR